MAHAPFSVLIMTSSPRPILRAVIEALCTDKFARVHVVMKDAGSSSARISRFISSLTVIPGDATDSECMQAVRGVAVREGTDVLLPVWTEDVLLVSQQGEAFMSMCPVVVPEAGILSQLIDKLNFVRLMGNLGLPVPKTLVFNPALSSHEVISAIGLPLLIKPRSSESGRGIRLLETKQDLDQVLADPTRLCEATFQECVPGEDVALTMLADKGRVFAIALKKRWFTRKKSGRFAPMCDVAFFEDDWLEYLGRRFVEQTSFSGIADFDMRVDFSARKAWFLESDPRLMGSVASNRLFGVNVPRLLVEHALGLHQDSFCVRNRLGSFLTLGSVKDWVIGRGWRLPRTGPVRTNWRAVVADPLSRHRA